MIRKRWWGWMLGATLATVAGMILSVRGEAPVCARYVTVQKGSVRNVAALPGRVAHLEETAAYALAPGFVEEVLVQPGQRVYAGQALVRLNDEVQERAASAWIANESGQDAVKSSDMLRLMESAVVRAPEAAIVRQVLTVEHALVGAGTPVVLLSSSGQAVICQAAEADAAKVRAGMRAELMLNGRVLGDAEVMEICGLMADPLTGRLSSQITLRPEKPLSLPAGTAIEANVVIEEQEHVNVIPLEAVTERGTIWWVHEGRCTEIPAEIVLSDEISAWVRLPEGLRAAIGEFEDGQRVTEVTP